MSNASIPLLPARVKQAGVYVITCTVNGRQYVGSGRSMMARWTHHKVELRANTHRNPRLQADWNRYGPDAFTCTVLEECADPAQLLTREEVWIVQLRSAYTGYNIRRSSRALTEPSGNVWRKVFGA